MFVKPYPHDNYVEDVAHHLASLGHEPTQQWTTSPDGEQLDGVIEFRGTANPDLWTGCTWLGWDQRDGWSLCDDERTLFPLDLDTYAAPEAVAARTVGRLTGQPDSAVGEDWDGAEVLTEAVREWENND